MPRLVRELEAAKASAGEDSKCLPGDTDKEKAAKTVQSESTGNGQGPQQGDSQQAAMEVDIVGGIGDEEDPVRALALAKTMAT